MNRFTKTMGIMVTLGAMVSGPFIAQAAALPATGGNNVKVSACTNLGDGISITHSWGSKYNLLNGNKDAGHGYKNYTYNCTSNTQYYVSWKPAVVPAPIPAQPELASLEVLHKMPNTGVPRAYKSYKNGLGFGSELTYQLVKNNLSSVLVKVTPEHPSMSNLSYAFAWTSDTKNTQFYTQTKISSLVAAANFQSSNEYLFNVTDYYRGKYSLLVAFVKNNDGVSAIPNMPAGVEVDDVIPLFLRFESLPAPAPTPVCTNQQGNGPEFTVCLNKTFTHKNSGIIVKPTEVGNNTVTLQFQNSERTSWTLSVNNTVHLVSTVNKREIDVTYLGKNADGQLRFSVKDVTPAPIVGCQNQAGTGGTFAVCTGNTLTLEHGVKATVVYANNDILVLSLGNTNKEMIYVFKDGTVTIKAVNAANRYYHISYRGIDGKGKALVYTEITSIQ